MIILPQKSKKNMTILKEGQILFNFGIRKPVINVESMLNGVLWHNLLMNQWTYVDDADVDETKVFYKHIIRNRRLVQILWSGLDIMGDGVYEIYKCIFFVRGNKFLVFPVEFEALVNSFEHEDYLGEIVKQGYISEKEAEVFRNRMETEKFAKGLTKMSIHEFEKDTETIDIESIVGNDLEE